ncbi:MAG: NUDIX hydrolase [Myxococcota bacterium]|nr:NUDIX hydrolase [Myxococcota bacterium]
MFTLAKWRVRKEKILHKTRVFSLLQMHAASQRNKEKEGTFVYLDMPNWVNVIALTPDNHVILVEQYRHGTREITLEIPGGMCDEGEDYITAGLRELREETGYIGTEAHCIGEVEPNPAIQNNRCGTILVKDVTLTGAQQLDPMEEIIIHSVPMADIPALIREGTIRHALVLAAFHFFRFYI